MRDGAGGLACAIAFNRRPFKHCDGFHVRGMREHVGHASGDQTVVFDVTEHFGIPGQGGRVAGHIDNAPGAITLREGLYQFHGAVARWINQQLVEMAQAGILLRSHLKQIVHTVFDIVQAVGGGIVARPFNQTPAPFEPDDCRT